MMFVRLVLEGLYQLMQLLEAVVSTDTIIIINVFFIFIIIAKDLSQCSAQRGELCLYLMYPNLVECAFGCSLAYSDNRFTHELCKQTTYSNVHSLKLQPIHS